MECLWWFGRFTFELIHNTKEKIYFYERAENHEAKERMFNHSNERIFNVNIQMDQGFLERGFICIGVGVRFADLSHILNIP